VGSVLVIDSTIQNCRVFVDTAWQESPWSNGSVVIENVALENVPIAVQASNRTVLEGSAESTTIEAWGQGHNYTPAGPNNFRFAYDAGAGREDEGLGDFVRALVEEDDLVIADCVV